MAKHGDYMSILNKAETLKAIGSIKKRSGNLRNDIQEAAIGAISHAEAHGDFTLASKLVDAVSKGNAPQVRRFFVGHMPVRSVKGKGFVKIKGKGRFNTADALATMWDEYGKSADDNDVIYNAMADLKSLIKAIENRIVKCDENEDNAMMNVYEELLALAAR